MNKSIQFNGYEVYPSSRELFFNSEKITLQKKSFDLLLYLIENKDRAISKDELLNKLWNGRVVTESVLSHAASKLRTVLDDNQGKGNIIRTVHGFGLQFVGDIRTGEKSSNHQSELGSNQNTVNIATRKKFIWGTLLVLVTAFIFYFYQKSQTILPPLLENRVAINSTQLPKISFNVDKVNQTNKSNWMVDGLSSYFNQLVIFSNNSLPLNSLSSEGETVQANAIENIVTAKQIDNTLYLTYTVKNVIQSEFNVPLDDLNAAITQVNHWICSNTLIENSLCEESIKLLTNDNAFVVENYLRGQSALSNLSPQKAVNFFEVCLQQDNAFILARVSLAQAHFYLSNYESAIAHAQTSIDITANETIKAHANIIIGKSYYRLAEFEKAQSHFLAVIDSKTTNLVQQGISLLELSKVKKDTENLDIALEHALKSQAIFQQHNTPGLIAKSNEILGDIKMASGELDLSKNYLNQALREYEKLNDYYGMEGTLASLGTVTRFLGDFNASLAYSKQRLTIAEKLNEPITVAGTHSQIAYILIELGHLDEAEEHAIKMFEVVVNQNEPESLLLAYYLQGEIAYAQENYNLAIDKINLSYEMAKELKMPRRQIQTLCYLGSIAIDAQLFEKAETSLNQCLELAQNNHYELFEIVSQLYFTTLYRKKSDRGKQKYFLDKAHEQSKLINNDKLSNEIFLEYFYFYIESDIDLAESYLQKIPNSYKENYSYYLSMAEINFKKNNLVKALELAHKAKQIAGDNWTNTHEIFINNIKSSITANN